MHTSLKIPGSSNGSLARRPSNPRATAEGTTDTNLLEMHYVYVLLSEKDGNFYIGCTSDLEERIKYHESGQVKSTKPRRPFKLVYFEEFEDKYEAFRREKSLKTAKGKKEIRSKIEHSGIV
jgi:putative endonuclease